MEIVAIRQRFDFSYAWSIVAWPIVAWPIAAWTSFVRLYCLREVESIREPFTLVGTSHKSQQATDLFVLKPIADNRSSLRIH